MDKYGKEFGMGKSTVKVTTLRERDACVNPSWAPLLYAQYQPQASRSVAKTACGC